MASFFGKSSSYLVNFEKMQSENLLRLEYHLFSIAKNHGDILRILPMILHYESRFFFPESEPGVLFGIAGYHPSEEERKLLARFFPLSKQIPQDKRTLFEKKHPLEFLYLMGSAGTVAFAAGSDMDFWVGIDKNKFQAQEIDSLLKNFRQIETWASTFHKLELHFFLTDIADLRKDNYGELGGESCGSALGILLKDEFYRSMIHIAGKYPKYWATPANTGEDTKESKRLESALAGRYLKLLDIGNTHNMESKDLFGAVLWQMLKALHSPFKSVIKIALLEYYASSTNPELLCNRLKRTILNQTTVSRTDPYLEMIEVIREYYGEAKKNPDEKRLLEECFLIKCLGDMDSKLSHKRFTALLELGANWGFSEKELIRLHRFRNWPYSETAELSNKIFSYFMNTYMGLRVRALECKGSISDRDLTIMGKTLKSYLVHKPDKIPPHFSLIDARNIHMIRFGRARDPANQEVWTLLADFAGTETHCKSNQLHAHSDLLQVCAWYVVNGYYHTQLKIAFQSTQQYTSELVSEFFHQFSDFAPKETILDQVLKSWHEKPVVKKLFLVPNDSELDTVEPLVNLTCYTLNSLGEVHTQRFCGSNCIEQLLLQTIIPKMNHGLFTSECFTIFRYGSPARPRNKAALTLQQKLNALCLTINSQKCDPGK